MLVLITGYYAWQTRRTVMEMHASRLLVMMPKIVLDLEMADPIIARIAVRNVGSGPALDLDITVTFNARALGGAQSESRHWATAFVAAGEHHELLPPETTPYVDQLVSSFGSISMKGSATDCLGGRLEINHELNVERVWRLQVGARQRFRRDPLERMADDIEKTRRAVESLVDSDRSLQAGS